MRVRDNAATRSRGISGRMGVVTGGTRPSQTGVEVTGVSSEDHAIGVAVDGFDEIYWLPRASFDYAGPDAAPPPPPSDADKAAPDEPAYTAGGRGAVKDPAPGWRPWRN